MISKSLFKQKFLKNSFILKKMTIKSFASQLPVLDPKVPSGSSGSSSGNDSKSIQPWVEIEKRLSKLRGDLVLNEHDKIEKYVIGIVRNYFRTTYKDGVNLDSVLEDHGLDSLDSIELCMILEDELGYIIEAETMPRIKSVRHLVNFIKHIEAYKRESVLLPQQKALSDEENWDDWLPKGETIKNKLFSFTKKKKDAKH